MAASAAGGADQAEHGPARVQEFALAEAHDVEGLVVRHDRARLRLVVGLLELTDHPTRRVRRGGAIESVKIELNVFNRPAKQTPSVCDSSTRLARSRRIASRRHTHLDKLNGSNPRSPGREPSNHAGRTAPGRQSYRARTRAFAVSPPSRVVSSSSRRALPRRPPRASTRRSVPHRARVHDFSPSRSFATVSRRAPPSRLAPASRASNHISRISSPSAHPSLPVSPPAARRAVPARRAPRIFFPFNRVVARAIASSRAPGRRDRRRSRRTSSSPALRTGAFFAATFFAGAFFAGAFFAGADFFTAVFGAGAFVLNIASARASSACGDARDRASDRARIASRSRFLRARTSARIAFGVCLPPCISCIYLFCI